MKGGNIEMMTIMHIIIIVLLLIIIVMLFNHNKKNNFENFANTYEQNCNNPRVTDKYLNAVGCTRKVDMFNKCIKNENCLAIAKCEGGMCQPK